MAVGGFRPPPGLIGLNKFLFLGKQCFPSRNTEYCLTLYLWDCINAWSVAICKVLQLRGNGYLNNDSFCLSDVHHSVKILSFNFKIWMEVDEFLRYKPKDFLF